MLEEIRSANSRETTTRRKAALALCLSSLFFVPLRVASRMNSSRARHEAADGQTAKSTRVGRRSRASAERRRSTRRPFGGLRRGRTHYGLVVC
ncbi:MAG: hypothetical protein DMF65_07515 [Acidobacteria bacterium]|nr:MAG: hypothetical protein DMF65_07515 [Acidobacteriota bacterium]